MYRDSSMVQWFNPSNISYMEHIIWVPYGTCFFETPTKDSPVTGDDSKSGPFQQSWWENHPGCGGSQGWSTVSWLEHLVVARFDGPHGSSRIFAWMPTPSSMGEWRGWMGCVVSLGGRNKNKPKDVEDHTCSYHHSGSQFFYPPYLPERKSSFVLKINLPERKEVSFKHSFAVSLRGCISTCNFNNLNQPIVLRS